MKNWISALLVVFLGAGIAGCSTMERANPDSSKEYIGMFTGAIAGGLAGSALGHKGGGRVTSITIGAVVGALIGCGLGMFLDEKDREKAMATAEKNKDPAVVNARQQQASNWRQSTPLVNRVETAAKTTPVKTPLIEKKELTVVKTPAEKTSVDKKVVEKTAKKESTVNDKFLSVWRNLPSTQWFVNDVKQEELG